MTCKAIARGFRALMIGVASATFLASPSSGIAATAIETPATRSSSAPETTVVVTDFDSLAGRSGKLRARILGSRRTGSIGVLERLFGDSAARRPGVYAVPDSASGGSFAFITLVPFREKERGRLGTYRIGLWPSEKGRKVTSDDDPEGFIEVTQSNQDTQVSEHFRLRDFLTKDQQQAWPKYLVLREGLVDKLELVIDDLQQRGIRVARLGVMSGFRTPQYNAKGVGKGGRASDSRHQYGDAADVFVDNNADGRMDDLNRDGRVDTRDAKVLLQSVERVEARHPDLIGGAGLYRATRAHGPFVHVDARGTRARWGRS